jgi:hypothetical protein
MPRPRSLALLLVLSLATVGGGCGGDDAGDDAPAPPDAGPVDATPAIDGDLVNDAGPLIVGDEVSFAEDQPDNLPAYGLQGAIGAGWVGDEYLAVLSSDLQLVAQRLSADGHTVGAPLVVARGAGAVESARMACSGERCLIVWGDGGNGAPLGELHGVIIGSGLELVTPTPLALGSAEAFALAPTPVGFMLATRVAPAGITLVHVAPSGELAAAPAPLFPNSSFVNPPLLACDAEGCVIAAEVCPAGGGLCVHRVASTDLAGSTAQPEGHEVATLPQQLVSAGTAIAALQSGGPDGAQLVRLDGHGDPVGSPTAFGSAAAVSGVFFDGVAYVALGYRPDVSAPGPGGTTIYPHMTLTRVGLDGTVLLDHVGVFDDAAGVSGEVGVAGCHAGDCLLLAAKGSGLLAYFDQVVTRLHEGHALDPMGRLVTTAPPAQVSSAVASNGSDFLVVWSQPSLVGDEVRARRIAADGHPVAGASQIVAGSTSTDATALASVDDGYLFAWTDVVDGRLRLAPLDLDGRPAAAPRVVATIDRESYPYTSVALACHAGQCLLAWTDDHVHVQRVSATGAPVDAAELQLDPGLNLALVTVAYNRGQYAVGWVKNLNSQRDQLDVALVPEDGPLVAPVKAVLEQDITYFGGPRLAPSTDGFLLMWEGIVSPFDPINQLMLAELHPDGTLGEAFATFGSSSDYPPAAPAVIVNGQDVLVAGILPLGVVSADADADVRLRLLRVGSGPRLLDPEIVDVGALRFRWEVTLHGAANARHDVLLVRDVFSDDVAHLGPHAVGRLIRW